MGSCPQALPSEIRAQSTVRRMFDSEKAINVFRSHSRLKEFSQPFPVLPSLDLCFRKTQAAKSHNDYRDVIVFEKLRFKMFSVHTKTKSQQIQIPPV